ncbi:NAD(+) synthase [Peptacetobacter hominis]|uniref:NH(3)-dependent NAD(+) synthetase n=1 Tax=Peptacetobacter hominis TaxID=2743610 RepID=A0A544QW21_9FIRM|nr:NAD(+) synthase [Peptacetobacter hominis]TQQ84884.1 NAD(+) synthase [Peptacetobacter hominis]
MDRKEHIEKVVQWLKDKVSEAHAKGLIVGVSGGIDSAVVSYLIKKACPENSMGVIMSIKSNPKDREDALKVIEGCNIEYLDLELAEPQNMILDLVTEKLREKNLLKEEYLRMTDANLRARIRMSTIYTVANDLGYLVVGTDNAAEIHTGYFTKHGDGGVDLLPLANLTKREVFEWAKELGVHEDIINKAPSAGLWEGQTDENEMGTTYDYIDAVVEGRRDEVPKEHLEIIDRLHRNSEHKRHTAPTPPKF